MRNEGPSVLMCSFCPKGSSDLKTAYWASWGLLWPQGLIGSMARVRLALETPLIPQGLIWSQPPPVSKRFIGPRSYWAPLAPVAPLASKWANRAARGLSWPQGFIGPREGSTDLRNSSDIKRVNVASTSYGS